MSKLKRFLNNQVKDRVKQNIKEPTMAADCCFTCKHAKGGYFTDTVYCLDGDVDVFKWHTCNLFERKEE